MIALWNAAVAKVTAAAVNRVYKEGSVPPTPAMPYLTVAVTFDRAEGYTLDASHGIGDYRVTTKSVGKDADGAGDTDDRARAALLDQYLVANGKNYGPGRLQVGSALVRDPDGGAVISITSTYLFATEE